MKLFDVYPLFDVNIVKGQGTKVWDDKGQEYLGRFGTTRARSIWTCMVAMLSSASVTRTPII